MNFAKNKKQKYQILKLYKLNKSNSTFQVPLINYIKAFYKCVSPKQKKREAERALYCSLYQFSELEFIYM